MAFSAQKLQTTYWIPHWATNKDCRILTVHSLRRLTLPPQDHERGDFRLFYLKRGLLNIVRFLLSNRFLLFSSLSKLLPWALNSSDFGVNPSSSGDAVNYWEIRLSKNFLSKDAPLHNEIINSKVLYWASVLWRAFWKSLILSHLWLKNDLFSSFSLVSLVNKRVHLFYQASSLML